MEAAERPLDGPELLPHSRRVLTVGENAHKVACLPLEPQNLRLERVRPRAAAPDGRFERGLETIPAVPGAV
jgi:hypothetical protein